MKIEYPHNLDPQYYSVWDKAVDYFSKLSLEIFLGKDPELIKEDIRTRAAAYVHGYMAKEKEERFWSIGFDPAKHDQKDEPTSVGMSCAHVLSKMKEVAKENDLSFATTRHPLDNYTIKVEAIFKGEHRSLGYQYGKRYTLKFSIDDKGYIAIMSHSLKDQTKMCVYSSLIKFLDNWIVLL